ncbi:MAG: DUF1249 domain-containing protein [Gammaproteobacteria bacterium]
MKAKPRNPMWYFERNFNVLIELLQQSQLQEQGKVEFELSGTRIILSLLEHTRYTLLLGIQQIFQPGEERALLSDLHFKVRIYLDAKLAEVVSYQGQQPLEPRYPFPNKRMFYPDEKRQTNLVLYDWLSNCSRLNFMESIAINCQN